MSPVRLPDLALSDVDAVLNYYLVEAGVVVAGQFLDAFERSIQHIRNGPGIGLPRLATAMKEPALRVWPIKGFPQLILYLDLLNGPEIWRVVHSARDIPHHLQE